MSYNAKVYKVFIASPDDVRNEREIVRSVIMRWNAINAESKKIVLLPVGWETHAAPETGKSAQEYINEEVLDKCDILIGIFWTKLGIPTKIAKSGTVEEIQRHISEHKLAMLYFSTKEIPNDVDLEQLKLVRNFKEEIRSKSLYGEFLDERDLENKLYSHLEIKIAEGKIQSTRDSDILARIQNDDELVAEINNHFPLVAKNLLQRIIDEYRSDEVWNSIINKLSNSPADLRESLIFMAKRGAFRHKAFVEGYNVLAKCSQVDFGNFMSTLYSINKFEFYDIYNKGLLEDSPFTTRLLELISKDVFYVGGGEEEE
ncbi:MAG: DUF4062 domain-containing protein [Anaeroplasmataceae bacterium]|nr:DUF4062 domain-containing protein [Anaeroplasmataceae bacterium]